MRIGLLGPGESDEEALHEGIEFLLGDVAVDQVVYLGADDDFLSSTLRGWAVAALGSENAERAFLDRAATLASEGTAEQIDELLAAEETVRRLGRVRTLPPSPARAVEMLADRILLFVHDKAVLDEEDIANAQLIVYGKSKESHVQRFGARYFLTPGPVTAGRVGVIELEDDGTVTIALFETSGVPVWRETMAKRTSKVSVTR